MRALPQFVLNSKTIMYYTDVPDSSVCCQHVSTLNCRPTGSRSTRLELIKMLQNAISKIYSFPRQGRSIMEPSFYCDRERNLGNFRKEKCSLGYLTALDRRVHTYTHIYVHTHINTLHGSKSMLQRQQDFKQDIIHKYKNK